MTRNKKDGSKVGVWFDPSNLQIKELNLEDMMRVKSLNRVGISKSKEEISSEKNSESPSEASKIAKTDTKTKPAETKK